MPNSYFQFKQFIIHQDRCAMKVTTDACLFGAWVAEEVRVRVGSRSQQSLDIGTGTGLLSLMLAQKNPEAEIIGVEIDEDAREASDREYQCFPWKDRIIVLEGDVKDLIFPRNLIL
jgi:tRNA1Val (adenine37-N6)-methyltransferase